MSARESQCDQVLRFMMEHGSITTMEAFERLKVTRLSGRIYDLREMGYLIKGETVCKKKKNGKVVVFRRYSLESDYGGGAWEFL